MILDFNDEHGKKRYEFCFVGFILGGCLQQSKGMQTLRLEVGIFEKLIAIGEPKPCGKKLVNGEPERQLKEDSSKVLQLDMVEFDLMFNYMAQVPWQTGTPGRQALETLDWMLKESKKNG